MDINIGDKFGRLTVVGIGHKKGYQQYYKVQCDCGSPVKEVTKSHLIWTTRSCGCLRKEEKDKDKERVRQMGLSNRKHFGCTYCGKDEHYAKGFCISCWKKWKRGTLYKNEI